MISQSVRHLTGSVVMRFSLLALAVWTALLGLSLWWNLDNQESVVLDLASTTARASFNRDQTYRYWASSHGGVYVEPTERTPPSPWLSHLPERDIVTTTGRKLTLMNPAYMLRQMMEDFGEKYGVRGRIVGNVWLNPNNKADPWESRAIRSFQAGETDEVTEVTVMDGKDHFRLIRPMVMEESCQKCHGHLGFANGDVRGGVSVAVPLDPYRELHTSTRENLVVSHLLIWLCGLASVAVIAWRSGLRLKEKEAAETALRLAHDQMEQRIQEQTKELARKVRELDHQRKALDEHAIVTITDSEGRITYANDKFCRITGYSREEFIGRPHVDLLEDPDLKQNFFEIWQHSASGKVWHGIIRNRSRDGRDYWVETTVVPFMDEEGFPFQHITIRTDITDRVEAMDAAERANQAKTDFLSSMSHELRTPLNAILGFGQILLMADNPPLPERQKNQVRYIMRGGEHLLELINEVLDLARIESGKLSLDIERVDCRKLIDECLSLTTTLVGKRSIHVQDRTGDDLPWLWADNLRARQALLNLLSNAIKYNRDGGNVWLDASRPAAGLLRLTVTDTGYGIPEEHIQEIFQPFHRLGAESRGIEGTGIGLVLTRRIIQEMGGRIGFDSDPSRGSRFWIELPAADPDDMDGKAGLTPAADNTGFFDDQGERLLLYIEDNPANLALMEAVIDAFPGIRMISCHNAELGIALAREKQPDVIVMDVNLTGMDGVEAVGILKAGQDTGNIPVLALTADVMPEARERQEAAGFVACLAKPVDVTALRTALRTALEQAGGNGTGGNRPGGNRAEQAREGLRIISGNRSA